MTIRPDEDRPVELVDDDIEILPDQTGDDTDEGWGERYEDRHEDDDSRYLDERPPHW